MPIDLRMLDRDGSDLYREWNKVVKKHNSYLVKNAYHKKRDMEGWNNKLKEINEHYRKMLKGHEEKMVKEQKELEKKKKELHEKEKKMAEIKRKLNKEKKAKESKSQKLRRSSRLAAKTKRRRCPNGTRRNKKTDNCEKKK